MSIEEFLGQLNTAEKGWGLWVNRNNPHEYHMGQYAFDNDRIPKCFVHVDNLDHLAHLRQQYISSKASNQSNETFLGQEWAEKFLSQWCNHNLKALV
ncbi:hypothetical protein Sta7437_2327 [Stanieria cyanosphaera PCC 7437]|uniref:Uncharacterized protein n=1 Tax=Stanieria cyanosphaera (strain ATCC 29371 / PCC 7437) TaxID=111780 RepID=K9XUY2_STAC7|nr:hypothetical protein [Stanieria cyanosphaera]AFZ35869.1 hypothetical protein Sta7437_2327 [Stanieria cyanosphaera PCC 7437]